MQYCRHKPSYPALLFTITVEWAPLNFTLTVLLRNLPPKSYICSAQILGLTKYGMRQILNNTIKPPYISCQFMRVRKSVVAQKFLCQWLDNSITRSPATVLLMVGKSLGILLMSSLQKYKGEAVIDKLQDLFTNCWGKHHHPLPAP